MVNGFRLRTTDTEEFQEQISPLAGSIRVRPASKAQFDITVRAAQLDNLSLFTVKAPSIKVHIAPPHEYFCLNIPLGKSFTITESRKKYGFGKQVHLLMPHNPLQLEAGSGCRVLAVKLNKQHVFDCALKLNGFQKTFESAISNRRPDSLKADGAMVQSFARLWSDIQRGDTSLESAIDITERQDALCTEFVLAMQAEEKMHYHSREQADPTTLARAEDFLCAHLTCPVSRAELAAVSGVSIRTLSRTFSRRWGAGPMSFLRARRMEAAYRELLGADYGATSVTEVALRYGFTHLGKFAVEYKQRFHESPSHTLRH
jgi:AraC-like DNA-binding protein